MPYAPDFVPPLQTSATSDHALLLSSRSCWPATRFFQKFVVELCSPTPTLSNASQNETMPPFSYIALVKNRFTSIALLQTISSEVSTRS